MTSRIMLLTLCKALLMHSKINLEIKEKGNIWLTSLMPSRKNKMRQFRNLIKIFNYLLKDMTQDYKPPDKKMLEEYLEAFCVEIQYEIRRAKPCHFSCYLE